MSVPTQSIINPQGRPQAREILTTRLIDRPNRPLWPEGFKNEVQLISTVVSVDRENDPDTVAMNASFLSVYLAPVPFQGPIAGIRVGTKADVRVDSQPETVPGAVEFVSRTTEFTPRYLFSEKERPSLVIRVRVRLDDAKGALHAGVPAFVTLAGGAGTAP